MTNKEITPTNPIETVGLGELLARVAIVVADEHPRDTEQIQQSVLMVQRPWWSNQGAGEWSLPGGKVEERDYVAADTASDVVTTNWQAAERAVIREIKEELGIVLLATQLQQVAAFANGPWISALFYCTLDTRPPVAITNSEIDGIGWREIRNLDEVFADHGDMLVAVAWQMAE